MKKQILFLAFFVLAILAGITNSYGQAAPSSFPPQTLTGCQDYPLHPLPGKAYSYQVTTTTTTGTVDSYTWWATKNPNFINTSGAPDLTNMLTVTPTQLLAASSDYNSATGGATVSITWSPQILANTQYQGNTGGNPSPTFVAVMANGNCTNNIQVYEIEPLKAFTVDIANATYTSTLSYGATETSCVDEVQSAVYDNTSKQLIMDYGTNTITFEVIAANFVNTWTPRFTIVDGLSGTQSATVGWAYTKANAQNGVFIESATGLSETGTFSGTIAVTTNEPNTVNGVSIWVTVVIQNHTYESLTDQPFTLAVDGVDSTGQWDLLASNCTDPGTYDQDDKATQGITARPTINDTTVDNENNAPDTFIIKTP